MTWRKRETQTKQGVRVEWEPAGTHSLRDGNEVGRSTSRESGLQIVLNEGGDPFLLRRTPYDKLFKRSEYAPDPFEPRRIFGQSEVPETARGRDMKSEDKAAWRPRRFDVAGAHPDEAWRAVANISEASRRFGKQFIGTRKIGAVNTMFGNGGYNKPLRFGNTPDVEVQRFLAQGVEIMDGLKAKMPLGLSDSHRQVRNRCNELSKWMEKVLARRPDEQPRQRFNRKPRMRM